MRSVHHAVGFVSSARAFFAGTLCLRTRASSSRPRQRKSAWRAVYSVSRSSSPLPSSAGQTTDRLIHVPGSQALSSSGGFEVRSVVRWATSAMNRFADRKGRKAIALLASVGAVLGHSLTAMTGTFAVVMLSRFLLGVVRHGTTTYQVRIRYA